MQRIGVFVCHCGTNIAATVDVKKVVDVMRKETERPEAVAAGTVKLCGVEYDDVLRMGNELLRSREAYDAMAHAVNPYGDGHACARIADAILWHFGRRSERPADFNA